MILVTGATGLIGSHLTLYLVRKGLNLRALYRNERSIEKTRRVFAMYESKPDELFEKIHWVKADITDITSLGNVLDSVSQIYHAAALVSFDDRDRDILYQTNVEGTTNLLYLAQENNIKKFLHFSSIAVLGRYDHPITEKTHWNWKEKHSEYAVTKYLAEMEVWRASQEGLPVLIVNPSVVLGAGFWHEGTGKLFQMIYNGMSFYPTGANDFVDVWDVVKTSYTLMHSDIINDSFIIGGHHSSYKELMIMISKSLHTKEPTHKIPFQLALLISYLNTLMAKITGRPYNLSTGIIRTLYQNPEYSSQKLIQAIHHQFIPLKASVANIAGQYLKTI